MSNDPTAAPMEWEFSRKLQTFGYGGTRGAIAVPLGADLLWKAEGHEADVEAFAVEVKQACDVPAADPGEVLAVSRQIKAMSSKAMSPLDETAGGSFMPHPEQGEMIRLLLAAEVVSRAGAQTVSLPPGGALSYPKATALATMGWYAPNAPITDSDPGTGVLNLVAKKAAGLTKFPNEIGRLTGGAVNSLIQQMLVESLALTIDEAALEGQGGSAQPLGILNWPRSAANTPTRDQVLLYEGAGLGATGNTFRPEDPLTMLAYVEESNEQGANAWVMRPLAFAKLANARADAVTTGDGAGLFLFSVTRGPMGNQVAKELAGLSVLTSTQVSKTRTKGGGSGLTYVLVGNFNTLVIGRVGAVELMMSNDAGFASDQVWVRVIGRADVGLRTPESFAVYDQLNL